MLMTTTKADPPAPGIYEGVDFAEYSAWDAVSNSDLSLLAKSPRHYRLGERAEPTSAMLLGELCHAGVFEAATVAERYIVLPAFEHDPENVTSNGAPSTNKTTTYYKRRKAEFEAAHAGKLIVSADEYEQMLALVTELEANELARELLADAGPSEVSIVWDEEVAAGDYKVATIRCKARIDKVAAGRGALVDLKKCQEVTDFPRSLAKYHYHRQLYHYVCGWQALTCVELTPWIICHEIASPISVLAAPLSIDAIWQGQEERDELLQLLARCRAADAWPGLANPSCWSLPEWAITPVRIV